MTVELQAPTGKYRTVGVDTFDGTDWVIGDYNTMGQAISAANSKGGAMLKTHVYDDVGQHIHSAGTF